MFDQSPYGRDRSSNSRRSSAASSTGRAVEVAMARASGRNPVRKGDSELRASARQSAPHSSCRSQGRPLCIRLPDSTWRPSTRFRISVPRVHPVTRSGDTLHEQCSTKQEHCPKTLESVVKDSRKEELLPVPSQSAPSMMVRMVAFTTSWRWPQRERWLRPSR